MNFWDTSALVAFHLGERPVAALETILENDSEVAIWWGTQVEFASAMSRREREGSLSAEQGATLLQGFNRFATEIYQEVLPSRRLKSTAQRLLRVHPLRAADGLQLAAALSIAEETTSQISFVSLDARLNQAALREGFRLLADSRQVASESGKSG